MRGIHEREWMSRTTVSASASAILLLGSLLLVMCLAGDAQATTRWDAVDCTRMGGMWDEATATCTVDQIWLDGWGLHVPLTMTLAVTDNFTHAATIIGPGPGVLIIDDVVVDGHLIISGTMTNEGPVFVYGRLTLAGTWFDQDTYRYVCDEVRGFCVESSTIGRVYNHGQWQSSGYASMPFGFVNDGAWSNAGDIATEGEVVNRGTMTNTGTMTIAYQLLNEGSVKSAGTLVNTGTIWNLGTLTGTVVNDGTILNMGVLSATVGGSGRVVMLTEHSFLPYVRAPAD